MRVTWFILLVLLHGFSFAQPGSLDQTFNANIASGTVFALATQPDGKVLIGGGQSLNSGFLTRVNPDGTPDPSISYTSNGAIFFVERTTGNKMLVSGQFTDLHGWPKSRIVRLEEDGTVDQSFTNSSYGSGGVWVTHTQADGKILVGGDFKNFNGTGKNFLIRLNSDGTLDNSFSTGTGLDSFAYSIASYSDGKILVGGFFTSYNGTAKNRIVRLNSNGSIDNSFDPGNGADRNIYKVILQPDQKIVIAGDFSSFNLQSRARIARLNSNGSLDNSFQGLSNGPIYNADQQADGKILIVGGFTSYNSTSRNKIARLNTDGSVDMSFDPGAGANNNIYYSTLQADGKFLIGGEFTTYNSVGRTRVARVSTGQITSIRNPELSLMSVSISPNPVKDQLRIQTYSMKKQSLQWVITDATGKKVFEFKQDLVSGNNNQELDVSALPSGLYFVYGYGSQGQTTAHSFIK